MKKLLILPALLTFATIASAQRDPEVLRVETRLVEVYATVLDGHGHFKDGLSPTDFQVLENGELQTVKYFETTSQPLHCAILLDTTGSMAKALPALKNAVSDFIDMLGKDDSIALYNFDVKVETQQEFTQDKAAVKRAALRLHAAGDTALFDAVSQVSKEISDFSGKKVIVVFTDGDDNTNSLTAQAAIQQARKNGIPLFTIAEGEAITSKKPKNILAEMSENTGGSSFEVKSEKDMKGVFMRISEEMHHIYLLAYQPRSKATDGKWRKIDVAINGEQDFRIRAKQGYFPKQCPDCR